MPDIEGLTAHQMQLIASYEIHENLVISAGATAELKLDAWIARRSAEDCAFLMRYFSCKQNTLHRHSEELDDEHARRPN